MEATIKTGCVGTGVFMLRSGDASSQFYDVWLCVLSIPALPLARWRADVAPDEDSGGRVFRVTVVSRSRVPFAAIGQRLMMEALVLGLVLAMMVISVWTVGISWAGPLLTGVLGSLVRPGVIAKLSLALELGVGVAGGAAPIAVLMFHDVGTPRVSLRAVLGSSREAAVQADRAA